MVAAARWTSLALLLLEAGVLVVKMEFTWAGLIFLPLSLGPLMVSTAACFFVRGSRPAGWLLASSILYALWFGFIYVSAFYLYPDPQAGIAFVWVGLVSLPVMIGLWITAFVIEMNERQRAKFEPVG